MSHATSTRRLPGTEHVSAAAARFAQVLRDADPATPVPGCPDWSALDLARHLTEVQDFWAEVLGTGALTDADIEEIEKAKTALPDTVPAVLDVLAEVTPSLVAQIEARDPQAPAWSWFEADQTAGFTRRMQAHEATVHRVDAEQTAGVEITPIDPELALDGIDHVIGVMRGIPEWGQLEAAGLVDFVAVGAEAADQPHGVVEAVVGRWWGTGPVSGTEFDEPALVLASSRPQTQDLPRATVTAAAQDLYLWLWGRGPAPAGEGDATVLATLEAAVAVEIE